MLVMKHYNIIETYTMDGGFPHSSVGKESACNAGDPVQFLGQDDSLEKG